MTLGERIKQARIERGMTQSELAGEVITRNMLSRIETGDAQPSLDTLMYIAKRLGIPAGFLLLDKDDALLSVYEDEVAVARLLFGDAKYKECIARLDGISHKNDEIHLLYAYSHFYIALDYFKGGSMKSAARNFSSALDYAEKTVYDTSKIECSSLLYLAVCDNINLPLLNFDKEKYLALAYDTVHYDFYKYLTQDTDHIYENQQYQEHITVKRLIKERKYEDAIAILSSIEDNKHSYPPNAYLMISVYADLEICYKNLLDFEHAYKYSSKRLSLIEGFSS